MLVPRPKVFCRLVQEKISDGFIDGDPTSGNSDERSTLTFGTYLQSFS